MQVKAYIGKKDAGILTALTDYQQQRRIREPFDVKETSGGIIVTLKPAHSGKGGTRRYYDIPREAFRGHAFRIVMEAAESGGWDKNGGQAVVFCTTDGQPLVPYHIPTRGPKNGEHAHFTISHKCVGVQVVRPVQGDATIVITSSGVEHRQRDLVELLAWQERRSYRDITPEMYVKPVLPEGKDQALLAHREEFRGTWEEFLTHSEWDTTFVSAALAAYEKAGTPECRTPSFVVHK